MRTFAITVSTGNPGHAHAAKQVLLYRGYELFAPSDNGTEHFRARTVEGRPHTNEEDLRGVCDRMDCTVEEF